MITQQTSSKRLIHSIQSFSKSYDLQLSVNYLLQISKNNKYSKNLIRCLMRLKCSAKLIRSESIALRVEILMELKEVTVDRHLVEEGIRQMRRMCVIYVATLRRILSLYLVDMRAAINALKFIHRIGNINIYLNVYLYSEKCPFCNVVIQELTKKQKK